MSAYLKRGIVVWILAFLTFTAALNAVNAVILWATQSAGLDYTFTPLYPVNLLISDLQVRIYLWASIALTFIFLGFTCVAAFRKPPTDPALIKMFVKLDGNLTANRQALIEGLEENNEMIGSTRMDLLDRLDVNRKASEKLFQTVDANLDSAEKDILGSLGKQKKEIQTLREELIPAIETSLSNLREETLKAIGNQARAIQKVGRLGKKSATAIEAQNTELTDVKTRIERIESGLVPFQPKLTSQDEPEKVKGIGPRLGKELKAMEITSVGKLLIADPEAVAEKTRASPETVKHLQAMAQLLMVPGVDENDAELLKEAEVNSIKELADQDPIQLSSRIEEIAKIYVNQGRITENEKPTLEEIVSWIKQAK
jgi:hypothetical protein